LAGSETETSAILSFGGARSGERGNKQKKAKKQKREFHTSKKRTKKEEKVADLATARTRVMEGLAHLGQQKFSTGPGGYDLSHWLKSLNLLLADFEHAAGRKALPSEYVQKKEEVLGRFSSPVDTSRIDSEAEAIAKEESDIRSTFDRERERILARLAELRAAKDGKGKEIEEQKAALEEIRNTRKSASFFAKLAGRAGPPTEPVEQKIKDLEKASSLLDEEALNLQSVRASIEKEGGTPAGIYASQWTRLDAIAVRLKELESERETKVQLAKERETAAKELEDAVSKVGAESPQK